MSKSIVSLSLIGLFSCLGYFCLYDIDRSRVQANVSYLRPVINNVMPVYTIPIIKVNGEIIGDQNATAIANQKGIGFIKDSCSIQR